MWFLNAYKLESTGWTLFSCSVDCSNQFSTDDRSYRSLRVRYRSRHAGCIPLFSLYLYLFLLCFYSTRGFRLLGVTDRDTQTVIKDREILKAIMLVASGQVSVNLTFTSRNFKICFVRLLFPLFYSFIYCSIYTLFILLNRYHSHFYTEVSLYFFGNL